MGGGSKSEGLFEKLMKSTIAMSLMEQKQQPESQSHSDTSHTLEQWKCIHLYTQYMCTRVDMSAHSLDTLAAD